MTAPIKLDAYLKVSCVEYNQEADSYDVTAMLCIQDGDGWVREVELPSDVCLKAVVPSASNFDEAAEKGLHKIAYGGGDDLFHDGLHNIFVEDDLMHEENDDE